MKISRRETILSRKSERNEKLREKWNFSLEEKERKIEEAFNLQKLNAKEAKKLHRSILHRSKIEQNKREQIRNAQIARALRRRKERLMEGSKERVLRYTKLK